MFESPLSKFSLFLSLFLSLLILIVILSASLLSDPAKVVFCDVGQGDAAYIRIKNHTDILVDAGPERKILDCLGKYMPFYDRTIELAIVSHPQKDHFGGLVYILDRYDTKKIWMSEIYNSSKTFATLLDKIATKDILLEYPKAGETADLSRAKIEFLWPSNDFLLANSVIDPATHSQLRRSGKDPNDFSLIFTFSTDGNIFLFTGDASASILNKLSNQSKIKSDILKIPHHGSKYALAVEFLELADPRYGVISVGSKNSYGHPAPEVLKSLEERKIIIRRTDKEGDIIFNFPN